MAENPYAPPKEADPINYEEILNKLTPINNKFVQAYSIRSTLMNKRLQVINDIKPIIQDQVNQSSEFIVILKEQAKALEYCNRNEYRLMDLLLKNKYKILNTFKLLDEHSRGKDKFSLDFLHSYNDIDFKVLTDLFFAYRKIVEEFYNYENEIYERLRGETYLIANFSNIGNVDFIKYFQLLDQELDRQTILDNNIKILINKNKRNIKILTALGIISGTGFTLHLVSDKFLEFLRLLKYTINPSYYDKMPTDYIFLFSFYICFASTIVSLFLLTEFPLRTRKAIKKLLQNLEKIT